MKQFDEGYLALDDVTLHYVEAGSGPLVILYHGFPSFWLSFYHQIEALSQHYHVVAVDGPGINLSSRPDNLEPFRLPNLAHQLDQLARHHAGDDPFILIGHDWGAALAWSYAQQYPKRLTHLVAMSAPPTNLVLHLLETHAEQRQRSSYMFDMRAGETHRAITGNGGELIWKSAYQPLRALPHYTEAMDEAFRVGLAQPGAIDGGINWYRANVPTGDISTTDYWPSRDASTSVPALMIWGDNDQTFVAQFLDELPRYANNLTILRLPETHHWPMMEEKDRVNAAITTFLASPAS